VLLASCSQGAFTAVDLLADQRTSTAEGMGRENDQHRATSAPSSSRVTGNNVASTACTSPHPRSVTSLDESLQHTSSPQALNLF
jgi:hypothetical protein